MAGKLTYEELEQKVQELEAEVIQYKQVDQDLLNFQTIFENIQVGLHIYHLEDINDDQSLKSISANRAAADFTGLEIKDLVGKRLVEISSGSHGERILKIYAEVIRSGKPKIFEDVYYGDNRIVQSAFSVRAFPLPNNCVGVSFENITERKMAEKEMMETQNSLLLAQEIAHIGFWRYNIKSGELYGSDELHRIYGLDPDKIKVTSDYGIGMIHPDDKIFVEAAFRKAMEDGLPYEIEYRIIRPNEEKCFVHSIGKGERDENGNVLSLFGTIQDITERKRVEAALRESETFTRAVLDNLPIGVAVNSVHPAVNFTYMNDNFPKFYRTTRQALAESDAFWDAVYEDSFFRKEIKARVLHDCESGDPGRMYWVDVPITRKGKETAFVTSKNIPIPDKNLVVSTVWDVTERKRAQESLRESEERYRLLFDTSVNPISLYDRDGKILLMNKAAAHYLGGLPEDFIGKRLHNLIPNSADFLMEKHQDVFRSGKGIQFEFCENLPVGEKYFLIGAYPIINAEGEIIGVQGVGNDITELKHSQEKLKESAEKIKMFAYSVSHDIKNPVVGINLLAKRIHEKYRDVFDEKGKYYCDLIMKGSEELAALVGQINVYISNKETPLRIERVNLNQVFDTLRDEFSAQILIRQINWSQPENPLEINVDRLSILRVLRNFVDNAFKYGGDGLSEIEIAYEQTDDFHILSVKDDGIGIDQKDYGDIFSPFRRSITSTGIEGTGLGLAIAFEIANQLKGKVWNEPGPVKGVIFHISILKELKPT